MTSIREILAVNLKKNRQKRGFTQEQMAEKANVSTHHIAMIETCNTFPKPEMLEQLALALDIEPYELFYMHPSAEKTLERLQEAVISNIERVVAKAIKETLTDNKI